MLSKHSQLKFRLLLFTGALVAFVLCIQCVRTYLYADSVLIPQEAEREAERQASALSMDVRSAGVNDPRGLGPVIKRFLETESSRVLWVRVSDMESHELAQGGHPYGGTKIPARWWESMERHELRSVRVDTPQAKAFVTMLPFRIQRPPRFSPHDSGALANASSPRGGRRPEGNRPQSYVVELAISYNAVADSFAGLRQNLIVGLIASIALLISVTVIALRARHYFRGKYLESEMQLAKRVQRDLQPKPDALSLHLEFAAAAVAADQIGGDFHDIFEAESGEIVIVLGDVSGKGVSAALLVGVLLGAIRSSTVTEHEFACERINRMLCERAACERFATLFWGVYDRATSTLRYVNAGHAAPLLIRRGPGEANTEAITLDEGGPVLGVLPAARYSAGTIKIESEDMLILYSDGISEATSRNDEEFGDDRILRLASNAAEVTAIELCRRVMDEVTEFASAAVAPDDRTLLVVRFPLRHEAAIPCSAGARMEAAA